MDGVTGQSTAVERLPHNQRALLEGLWLDTRGRSQEVREAAWLKLSALMMWEHSFQPESGLADELTCLTNVARAKFDAREG